VRSALALVAGFLAVAVSSLATDQVLHSLGVYPPWGEPMHEPALNGLALSYRLAYGVLGPWVAARLAPRAPMGHALTLGGVGAVLSALGGFAARDMGPLWYPMLLALSSVPTAWLGGWLATRR
jgi:hypothetical protein